MLTTLTVTTLFRNPDRSDRLPSRLRGSFFLLLLENLGLCISLRPLVEELKTVRKQCMEIESEYQEKKGAHEKVGAMPLDKLKVGAM